MGYFPYLVSGEHLQFHGIFHRVVKFAITSRCFGNHIGSVVIEVVGIEHLELNIRRFDISISACRVRNKLLIRLTVFTYRNLDRRRIVIVVGIIYRHFYNVFRRLDTVCITEIRNAVHRTLNLNASFHNRFGVNGFFRIKSFVRIRIELPVPIVKFGLSFYRRSVLHSSFIQEVYGNGDVADFEIFLQVIHTRKIYAGKLHDIGIDPIQTVGIAVDNVMTVEAYGTVVRTGQAAYHSDAHCAESDDHCRRHAADYVKLLIAGLVVGICSVRIERSHYIVTARPYRLTYHVAVIISSGRKASHARYGRQVDSVRVICGSSHVERKRKRVARRNSFRTARDGYCRRHLRNDGAARIIDVILGQTFTGRYGKGKLYSIRRSNYNASFITALCRCIFVVIVTYGEGYQISAGIHGRSLGQTAVGRLQIVGESVRRREIGKRALECQSSAVFLTVVNIRLVEADNKVFCGFFLSENPFVDNQRYTAYRRIVEVLRAAY